MINSDNIGGKSIAERITYNLSSPKITNNTINHPRHFHFISLPVWQRFALKTALMPQKIGIRFALCMA
ncbi:MAG: hypothetical protein IH984_00595 [Planctomycetes bacterium]|nr:hypothetical protein [Planctomycetota bacterium]